MAIHELLSVPEIYKPLEHLIIWERGFSEEELDEIVSLCEMIEFDQGGSSKGRIGGSAGSEGDLNYDIRETDVTWVEPCDSTAWIYSRLRELAARINDDKFQFDLTHFQPLQYGKYKENGHYDWHTDSGPNMHEHRKLSFVLGLSDPDDYEGGELEVNVSGNSDKSESFKIRRGQLVVFPSYVPHRVKPVTNGQRLTLVGWAVGPKFR